MNPRRSVEVLYRERIDRMTIAGRVQRAADLFAWSRGFVARQVVAENGADPVARSMITRASR